MASKPTILSTAVVDTTCALHLAEVDVLPFIKVEPIINEPTASEVRRLSAAKATVVFTSANAVRAVAQMLPAQPHWSVYCIGNATATSVTQLLTSAIVQATAENATLLADVIKKHNEHEVIFFCGDKRLGILPDKLNAAGVKVAELEVYRTVETPQQIQKSYDAILFFSPSAVSSYFSANTIAAPTVAFAIGATTADAVKAKCDNNVIVCNNASKQDLLLQAITYFNKQAAKA